MFGVSLFVHAVKMVINNPGAALRISGVLIAVQFVATWAFSGGQVVVGNDIDAMLRSGAASAGGVLVVSLVTLVTSLWIAVAWHRYILVSEEPGGVLPAFNGRAIGAYFLAGIIFALILILLSIPVGILAGLIVVPLVMAGGGEPGFLSGALLALLLYLPLAYVGYRISPILPSAALGARMPLKEAWYATGTSGAAFVVLTVVSVVAALVVNAPALVLGSFLGALWSFLVQWATVLVGASILTTIYGHYVEGRALDV
jgi:hypothetical protein